MAEQSLAHTHTPGAWGGWSRRRARDRSALAPSRAPARLQRRREPPRPRGDLGSLAAGARPPPHSLTSGSSGTSSMSGQGSLSWASGIAPPPGRPRSSGCPGRAASRVPGSPALRPRAPAPPRETPALGLGRPPPLPPRHSHFGSLRHPAPPRPLATCVRGGTAEAPPQPPRRGFPGADPRPRRAGVLAPPPPRAPARCSARLRRGLPDSSLLNLVLPARTTPGSSLSPRLLGWNHAPDIPSSSCGRETPCSPSPHPPASPFPSHTRAHPESPGADPGGGLKRTWAPLPSGPHLPRPWSSPAILAPQLQVGSYSSAATISTHSAPRVIS